MIKVEASYNIDPVIPKTPFDKIVFQSFNHSAYYSDKHVTEYSTGKFYLVVPDEDKISEEMIRFHQSDFGFRI